MYFMNLNKVISSSFKVESLVTFDMSNLRSDSIAVSEVREDEPLQRKSSRKGKLTRQSSVVPMITDSKGAMKMTFWM